MEKNYTYYFSKVTITEAWKNNDSATLDKMLVLVTELHKENWFGRVIYSGSAVAEWQLRELAENAFLLAWAKFNEGGKAGKIIIRRPEYINLLYKIFKNIFLKALVQEKRHRLAEQTYTSAAPLQSESDADTKDDNDLFDRTQKILNTMNPGCAELIQWRFKQRLSFDEIALKKGIKRASCIKILSRCKTHFLELFRSDKKL